ncbi:hypothetical protein JTE90_024177 [Oedothorax gibbosus]|uniref:Uncharacterized protein n=1 Tax=Oedothorax gibbosus TaxID=931172 RepID=A0AAV6UES1_9ARAC|nr:hypothetical protein JTE90_024177 [Oedothorax gibbosus]
MRFRPTARRRGPKLSSRSIPNLTTEEYARARNILFRCLQNESKRKRKFTRNQYTSPVEKESTASSKKIKLEVIDRNKEVPLGVEDHVSLRNECIKVEKRDKNWYKDFKVTFDSFPKEIQDSVEKGQQPSKLSIHDMMRTVVTHICNIDETPGRKKPSDYFCQNLCKFPNVFHDRFGDQVIGDGLTTLMKKLENCPDNRKRARSSIEECYPDAKKKERKTTRSSCGCVEWKPLDLPSGESDLSSGQEVQTVPKATKRRRSRCTQSQRKQQLKNARRKYSERNSEVIRAAVQRYQQANPEVNRTSVQRYQKNKPEVHRLAQHRYENNNPDKRVERKTLQWKVKALSSFAYKPEVDYEADNMIVMGTMSHMCSHCNALKGADESPGSVVVLERGTYLLFYLYESLSKAWQKS